MTAPRSNSNSSSQSHPPSRRGPRPLGEVLGDLFAARGFGRLRALKELEDAWNEAVGEPGRHHTRIGEVRRGVLNVTVANSTLLAELAAFQKPALLAALRQNAPGTVVHDIRFRVGPIGPGPGLAPDGPVPGPSPEARPQPPGPRPKRKGDRR